jgi:outer membrane protein OmpA-like peptidoglycan-associated protein
MTAKTITFICLFVSAISGTIHAQIASRMDEALTGGDLSYSQSAYFVLSAAKVDYGDPDSRGALTASLAYAASQGWLPRKAAPANIADAPIKLGELAFLITQAFNLKGGILYSLFRGPHYAYRELTYRGYITGATDPSDPVTGEKFFEILGYVLDEWEQSAVDSERSPVLPEPLPKAAAIPAREEMAEAIRAELMIQEVADASVRVVEEGVTITISNIQFSADSSELTEGEKIKIREIAAILSRYPGLPILISGHTALAGNAAGRLQISRERAQAVADYLESLGCRRADEMTVMGYGAERPLTSDTTAAGQAVNRRVEITILDRETGSTE